MWTGIIKAKKRGKEDNAEEEKQEDQHQQETLEEDFAEEGGEEETPKEKDEVVSPETLTTVKRPREGSAKKSKGSKAEQPAQTCSFPADTAKRKWQQFTVQPSDHPEEKAVPEVKHMTRVKRSASSDALGEVEQTPKRVPKAKTTAAKTRAAKANQPQPLATPKSASASSTSTPGHFDLMADSCLKSVDDTALLYGLLPLL